MSAALALCACKGDETAETDDPTATATASATEGAETDADPTEGGGETDADPTEGSPPVKCDDGPVPGPMPRLVRLTHSQYDNTVEDLLQVELDPPPSQMFLDDPGVAGFDNNAAQLVVKDRLGRDYRRAAEALSETAVAPDTLAKILPCQPEGDGSQCAQQFVREFGKRAFRRPLTPTEEATYVSVWGQGNGLYQSGTPFEQGIRFVVEALLQSPHFLWRLELSEQLDGDNVIPLSGYEVATRLSYMLWGSTPDDALLLAAESGELDTEAGIEAQARRLLDDPKSRVPVEDFHRQWLELEKLGNLQKNPDLFPEYTPALASAMEDETQRFIEHVIFELEGDYAALITAPVSFVNADLAALYGLQGQFGPELVEAALDPTRRGGLLTQASFLATHAFTNISSPIHRGAFVQRQILCNPPPPPPGDADLNLPPIEGEIHTTREQVEAHTESKDYCKGCHGTVINPPGYSFEHYDALGKWRDLDNGYPVDASGSIILPNGEEFTFTDAIDLVGQISTSETGPKCYLTNWFRYGYGRDLAPVDRCTVDDLHETLASSGYNIKELLVALTLTKTFRFRAVEE